MANAFKRRLQRNVTGNAPVVVDNWTVPAAMQVTVIGLSCANVGGATTTVTVDLFDGTNATRILLNGSVPAGDTLVVVGAEQKLVMQPNDRIRVTTPGTVDVIMSTLEIT
jgi:hypothetical protein